VVSAILVHGTDPRYAVRTSHRGYSRVDFVGMLNVRQIHGGKMLGRRLTGANESWHSAPSAIISDEPRRLKLANLNTRFVVDIYF
jgi:hypothetical protein